MYEINNSWKFPSCKFEAWHEKKQYEFSSFYTIISSYFLFKKFEII